MRNLVAAGIPTATAVEIAIATHAVAASKAAAVKVVVTQAAMARAQKAQTHVPKRNRTEQKLQQQTEHRLRVNLVKDASAAIAVVAAKAADSRAIVTSNVAMVDATKSANHVVKMLLQMRKQLSQMAL